MLLDELLLFGELRLWRGVVHTLVVSTNNNYIEENIKNRIASASAPPPAAHRRWAAMRWDAAAHAPPAAHLHRPAVAAAVAARFVAVMVVL